MDPAPLQPPERPQSDSFIILFNFLSVGFLTHCAIISLVAQTGQSQCPLCCAPDDQAGGGGECPKPRLLLGWRHPMRAGQTPTARAPAAPCLGLDTFWTLRHFPTDSPDVRVCAGRCQSTESKVPVKREGSRAQGDRRSGGGGQQ